MSDSLNTSAERLSEELREIRQKPLSRQDEAELANWHLGQLAQKRFPLVQGHRNATRRLLQSAIDRLPDKDLREAQAALILLGLAPNTASLSIGARQRRAADVLHVPFHTFRTSKVHEPRIMRHIVDSLMRIAAAPHFHATNSTDADDPPWIERPKATGRLNYLISEGRLAIGIYGGPGVGKTRMAREITYGESALFLDASNAEFLNSSIFRQLSLLDGFDLAALASQLPSYSAMQLLGHVLESDRAPRFLILDNATSGQLLAPLLDRPTRSTIIVTSRTLLAGLSPRDQVVLKELEPEEAAKLVRNLLPHLTPESISTITEGAGNHPLAVKAICSLMALDLRLSAAQMIASLSRAPRYTLQGMPEDASSRLYDAYSRTVEAVGAQNELAATILQHASMLDLGDIDEEILKNSACSQLGIHRADIDIAAIQAFRVLKGYFLLDEDLEARTCRLHSITRTILRDLYRDRWDVHLVGRLMGSILAACKPVDKSQPNAHQFLEANHGLIWHLHTATFQPGVEMTDNIEAMLSRFGRATQLVARASGVDPRLVLTLALSLSRETVQVSVHFLKIEHAQDGPKVGIDLKLTGGKRAFIDLAPYLATPRMPTILVEWDSEDHKLIRCVELLISDDDRHDIAITAASDEEWARITSNFADNTARTVKLSWDQQN